VLGFGEVAWVLVELPLAGEEVSAGAEWTGFVVFFEGVLSLLPEQAVRANPRAQAVAVARARGVLMGAPEFGDAV
jgi:hypothetical protein